MIGMEHGARWGEEEPKRGWLTGSWLIFGGELYIYYFYIIITITLHTNEVAHHYLPSWHHKLLLLS